MRITEREQRGREVAGTAEAGVTVLSVSGELSGEGVAPFREQVMQRLDSPGQRDIVLDLTELDGVDSGGLEALLALQDAAAERLAHLRLAGCPEALATVLRLTRLTDRFDMDRSVDEALATLGALGANA